MKGISYTGERLFTHVGSRLLGDLMDDLCGMRPCTNKVGWRVFFKDQEEKWFCGTHVKEYKGKPNVRKIERLLKG